MSALPLQDDSSSSHPASSTSTSTSTPDPTALTASSHAAQGGLAPAHAARSTELARLKVDLKNGLRQYPDFPTPGILFEDIMPLFSSHTLFTGLVRALELQVADVFHTQLGVHSDVDVVVGLESRGFLFGPTLALRLGAGFVPVRKQGKLPGNVETETFKKEYGEDVFQMQIDAIKPGAKVVIVDDIIATGGSAAAAGNLVKKLGGNLLGYIFIMELDFLKGRDKLDAPVHTLLSGQEEGLKS
ncbi:adenine phosphoribosyltransferase [Acrodontium crateriforme]|uniref:adenine phosphoribosyltransferase n=1 Tax=Acrodontium crateriforme TaxID=150365 RepID=A0AAQ3M5G9_9PEZI|nr:adenine phosphoribosyltransferase [Acrodontium crateriforme]